jgi:hypothetical protein
LIFNKSSIDRGMFRSTSVKKYLTQIQKNQSTSQDDLFMKPDPTKTTGIRQGSYDKLNESGYVPEETVIVNGDIILSKVSPIPQIGDSNKIYKDSSEVYRSNAPGVVDKVITGIYNNEGYEIRKMRIRSERVPRIGDKFCCFDKETEVLTSTGWIKFDKLTKTHKVATLDNDKLVYANPTDIQQYDFNGNMYKLNSNQVDLLVTPNHRMYMRTRGGKYEIKRADEIYGKIRCYKKNVDKYEPINKMDKFTLPAYKNRPVKELDLTAWLTFFGIWLAEGCTGNRFVQFSAHKERVKIALNNACQTLGFKISKWNEHPNDLIENSWAVCDVQLLEYFKEFDVGAINKYMPEWVWNLNRDHCKTLINGMMLGDGHTMKNGTRRYDTSSTKLANDFQRLCLHAGYSTNINVKYPAGHISVCKGIGREGEEIKSTVDAYRMTIIESQNEPIVNKYKARRHDSWQFYNGKVYCCTVPSGVIYVRRNGLPVWSGNSRHGQKGTIGIAKKQSNMPFTKYGISPDIIVNPNAIPSRMTIGQLVECLIGKSAAIEGMEADGTPFNGIDIDVAEERLGKLGFNKKGYEYLYNGETSRKMKTMIFIGPTHYQRLKHLVEDKIHSRSRGPRTLITRLKVNLSQCKALASLQVCRRYVQIVGKS